MQCDNQVCPVKYEPETPCWEIAKREGTYQDISNTCKDCIVHVLKEESNILDQNEIKKIIIQREFSKQIEAALLNRSLRS